MVDTIRTTTEGIYTVPWAKASAGVKLNLCAGERLPADLHNIVQVEEREERVGNKPFKLQVDHCCKSTPGRWNWIEIYSVTARRRGGDNEESRVFLKRIPNFVVR